MEQFLIDTNCVSDYLSSLLPSAGMQFMDTIIDNGPNISIITQIELLCWNTRDSDKIAKVKSFISECKIYEITSEVVLNCVAIRKGKKIKTPDAIIAATALSFGYRLITNNEIDFKHISKLKIVNPKLL